MRVLMLSCNTGEGHNSTARAIMEVLQAQGAQCRLLDVLTCVSPKFSRFIASWHTRIYRYAPKLFDGGYRAMERYGTDPEDTTLIYELLSLGAGKLWQVLQQESYDAIVCTHTFAGMMMTQVRRTRGLQTPCFLVETDYTCHPTAEQCDMDGYFIPSPALTEEFVQAGLPASRLIPAGIPVRRDFHRAGDKAGARQVLGLPAQGPVVLLMCGSMGCGPMRRIARRLPEQLPDNGVLVAICGNNKRLASSLLELELPRLQVVGYTRDVPAYMDAADMLVTKPGGLSVTEAAVKHLPMVLINTVGGCEARNFDFFLTQGYAVGSDDCHRVIAQAAELAGDLRLQQALGQRLEQDFSGDSARQIAGYVLQAGQKQEKALAGV